jgi:CBS domain containing-hemolysin-like protein
MVVQLALIVVLIAGNFFFVAAEFSITRIRPTEVAELEADGVGGARSLRHAVDHIDAYLSACQFGITLCSIGLGLAGEPAVAELLGPVLEPLGGFAGTRPTGLAFAPPMRLFYLATKPIVDLLNWLGNLVLRPFGIPPASEAGHAPHSEDELRQLVRHSRQEGMIAPAEHEFTDNVFTFGDKRAREAMVPGPEVELLTVNQSLAEAIDQVNEANRSHTRFPLCEADGGLDTALGIVHAKDLLGASGRNGEASLRDLARPLHRVPDGVPLDELLESLRHDRQHLALVVDEHDKAVGIITLEDVLEEIVGEIEDEFDSEADEVSVGEPRVPADGEEAG